MAQVMLRINGFGYPLGCNDGEEAHLMAMGAEVEKRILSIKDGAGQIGEARALLLAALMLADELHDINRSAPKAEAAPAKQDPKLARRLNKIAKRAEDIASDMEAP